MHSQLALTEHASLNLAPLILLDPVLNPPYSLTGTSVKQIAGGISGYLWNNYLSHNRLLSDLNYVFSNDIVLEKNFYIRSFWFWYCGWFEEYVLGTLQFFIPRDFFPHFLVKICMRPNTTLSI